MSLFLIVGGIILLFTSYFAHASYYKIFNLKEYDHQTLRNSKRWHVLSLLLVFLFLLWVIPSNHTAQSIVLSSIVIVITMLFISYRLYRLMTYRVQ